MNYTEGQRRFKINAEEREALQAMFDRSFTNGDEAAAREQYRAFRMLERRRPVQPSDSCMDLTDITENVTAACDIITADTEKSFIFCGGAACAVKGDMHSVTGALLNLLSNAFFYSRENLIITSTSESAGFVKTEIRSGGAIDFDCAQRGGGIAFVRRVCESHGGKFFMESDGFCTASVMLFPAAGDGVPTAACPDFFQLINDRLSPVYTEFFGQQP